MIVTYTGRHLTVRDEMKEYLEKRMQKFKFYYDHILNINVIVGEERGKIFCELKVDAEHDSYFAKETFDTWQEAFDAVTDDIETEIKKKKDRIKEHHK